MKYYFFKTVRDGSRNRLNPLPFQTASDGTAIIQKLNTQVAAGGMKLREAYPIGTVFCSSMCELSARAGTPYYCAGDIYPILDGNSNYDFNLPTPTKEMLDAYDEYKNLAKQEAASTLFAGTNTPTAPKKQSLLDKIRTAKRYCVPIPTGTSSSGTSSPRPRKSSPGLPERERRSWCALPARNSAWRCASTTWVR